MLLCALATRVLAAPPGELCLSDARGLKAADARLFDGIGPYRAPKVSNDGARVCSGCGGGYGFVGWCVGIEATLR